MHLHFNIAMYIHLPYSMSTVEQMAFPNQIAIMLIVLWLTFTILTGKVHRMVAPDLGFCIVPSALHVHGNPPSPDACDAERACTDPPSSTYN